MMDATLWSPASEDPDAIEASLPDGTVYVYPTTTRLSGDDIPCFAARCVGIIGERLGPCPVWCYGEMADFAADEISKENSKSST